MKKLLLMSGLVLALAACGNGTEEAQSEETHEPAEENAGHHEHVLDIKLAVDNEADPSVVSVELLKEDKAYEADRVRFEVQQPETEEITWLNAENQGDGVYTAETSEVAPGEYSITAHVNGPEDLHEHTDDIFEIK